MRRRGRVSLALLGLMVPLLVLVACGTAAPPPATGTTAGVGAQVGSPVASPSASPAAPSATPVSPATPATPVTPEEAMRTITYADNGQTLALPVHSMVLVNLGEERSWTLDSDNPAVLHPVPTFVAMPGTQGLFTLAQAGQVTITANGRPLCATPGAACPKNILHFQVTVIAQE